MVEKKPGQFWARCRKDAWIPLADVLALPREQQPAVAKTRWDNKLRLEVCAVTCRFETADRGAYLAHMADVHGKKPRGPAQLKKGRGNWHPPKLLPEGQPFKASTKDLERDLETCTSCGLVAEVGGRAADVLWWAEHLRGCALAQAAS